MFLATLLISGREWLLPALGLVGATLLVLLWAYLRGAVSGGVRAACLVLKALGLLALAACLLEPLWSGQRAKPGANFFAVVADNSLGMQIKDRGATLSRGEVLRELLLGTAPTWQGKLEENFQVRRYFFDSRVQATRDFSELAFDGRSSAIGAALQAIAQRYQGQPLAGVLLLTDGNATDLPDGAPDLAGLPPIYPVVLGTDEPIKDIAVQRVGVTQTSFEDAPVTIQADVAADGYEGESLVAQLLDVPPAPGATSIAVTATNVPPRGGTNQAALSTAAAASLPKIVQEQTQRVRRAGEPTALRFRMRPDKSGISFYHLRVAARSETGQFGDPKLSTEATLANNSRLVVVDRRRGPYRILYVSGRPNWEFKFLRRALEEDDQVELVGLIRIARREPKFEFRGRTGESSNPLFRGFDGKTEDTERYDQPVLIRLNTRDEFELRGGFPKTAEELFAYHAVVLDDLESEFFSHDQMALLEKFVSERGGGFLMLGGAESFHQGKYERTPIANVLPVYLDHLQETKPLENLRLTLTREGWLQPWARVHSEESEEKARLEAMVPFQVLNRMRDLKPGASPIATVTDAHGAQHPALVVQRYGHGRGAALMIGDFWRWGLHDEVARRDMDKAWRQLVRWLVVDVPRRIEMQAEPKPGDPNQAIVLQLRARDAEFHPLDNASASVTVRFVGLPDPASLGGGVSSGGSAVLRTNSVHLTAEPALNEAGLYQATFIPRETGAYLAEAVVTDANGVEVGRAEAGWTANPDAEEFRSLKPNRALLEAIAKKTGGEILAADKLEEFANRLPNRKVPITEAWSFPLWHQPAVFLFALLCFVAEWGLRRWKGMA
ncbi:MAG: hypothetical protein HYY24_07870 [Verrucomicrobia bacterium]|nr:hypothetical protein [Verrucomicrobiota bacterium]